MLPLKLKISGLYSYIEEQTIDFTELTNAGLFGIFGEIGSGKSSILDAICFSIYQKTERLNISGDNRYYNMLNLKCSSASVTFVFQAGKKKSNFEINFELKRDKKDFEKVSLVGPNYSRFESENKVPITKEEVILAIGLTYENFKRTIIIPQGKFKDFIELSGGDRTKMMKELFNLHRFDLSDKVAVLEKKNTEAANLIEGELKSYHDVNGDKITSLETELEVLTSHFNELTINSKQQAILVSQLEVLKKRIDILSEKKTALITFEEKEKKDQQREYQLNEYEHVNVEFKILLSDLFKLSNELKEKRQLFENLEIEKNTNQKQVESITQQLILVKVQKQGLDIKKEQVNEFDLLIRLKEELLKSEQLRQQKSNLTSRLTHFIQEYDVKFANKKSLQQEIITLENELFSESKLEVLKHWFLQLNEKNKAKNDLLERKKTVQQNLIEIEKEFEIIFQSDIKEFFSGLSNGYSRLEFEKYLELLSENFHKDNVELRFNLTHMQIQEKLVSFSANLTQGKPCDLCGSVHHPAPLSQEFSKEKMNELIKQIKSIEDNQKSINALSVKIGNAFVNKDNIDKQLLEISIEVNNIQEAKEILLGNSPDSNFTEQDNEHFSTFYHDAINKHNFKKEKSKQILTIEEALTNIELSKSEIQTHIGKNDVSIASCDTLIGMLREDVKQLNANEWLQRSPNELTSQKKALIQEINTIEENYQRLTTVSQNKELLLQDLKTRYEILAEKVNELDVCSAEKSAVLSKKLKEINKTEEQVKYIISLNLNVNTIRESISENRRLLYNLKGEINILENDIAGKLFHEADFLAQKEKMSLISEDLVLVTENKGGAESKLKEIKSALEKKQNLEKDFSRLSLRGENLFTLKKLFKSNGFVDFMSIRYLYNIVEVANVRFQKMTKQQYKLILYGENNDFYIVDYLNGGKKRSIKSLGGGHTFQACLALALALSENIQKMAAIDQQFFFLDEGFGTLDKHALQLVFDTLKSLKNENRVVGLISHVEELQQEMDVFLKINSNTEIGTVVAESWK